LNLGEQKGGRAPTVPQLICIIPGRAIEAIFSRNCVTNVWAGKKFASFIAVWCLKEQLSSSL